MRIECPGLEKEVLKSMGTKDPSESWHPLPGTQSLHRKHLPWDWLNTMAVLKTFFFYFLRYLDQSLSGKGKVSALEWRLGQTQES